MNKYELAKSLDNIHNNLKNTFKLNNSKNPSVSSSNKNLIIVNPLNKIPQSTLSQATKTIPGTSNSRSENHNNTRTKREMVRSMDFTGLHFNKNIDLTKRIQNENTEFENKNQKSISVNKNIFNSPIITNNMFNKNYSMKNLNRVENSHLSPVVFGRVHNISGKVVDKENYHSVPNIKHSSESLQLPNLFENTPNKDKNKDKHKHLQVLKNSDSRKKIYIHQEPTQINPSNKTLKNNFILQNQNNKKFIKMNNDEEKNTERKKFYSTLNQPGVTSYNVKFKNSKEKKSSSSKNLSLNNLNKNTFSNGIISDYAYKTQPGKTEFGVSKTNQDSYLAFTNIFNLDHFNIFGILDGHGVNGHHVSNEVTIFISEYFSKTVHYIKKKIEDINKDKTNNINNGHIVHPGHNIVTNDKEKENEIDIIKEDLIYEKLKENNYKLIRNAFYEAEREITYSKYDVNFSGTTCNLIFIIKYKIICANVGDSRAIIVNDSKKSVITSRKIVTYNKKVGIEAEFLSIDHKPDLENEKVRIISAGGRIDQVSENGYKSGPARVWVKNENYPGLAMSRSIGDIVAESVGVICDPEIIENDIGDSSKFIVIASDGIWEFLDNNKVTSIVHPYYLKFDPTGACNALVKEATERWEKEDVVIDDITVIVVLLNCK